METKKIKLERQTIINIGRSIIHNPSLLNLKLSIITSGEVLSLIMGVGYGARRPRQQAKFM